MDQNTRSFILASLFYLAAGAVLGAIMAVAPGYGGRVLFSHVHLLLAGFMAMMIYGVGYFILPRFASTAIRWPSLVTLHFWLANASLLGMVVFRPVAWTTDSRAWMGAFHVSVALQTLSILLFATNLGWTLLAAPKPSMHEAATAASSETPSPGEGAPSAAAGGSSGLRLVGSGAAAGTGLDAASTVGDFVDRKTGALELLLEAGLTPLKDPEHLAMVRRVGIPLAHACKKHGIDFAELLPRLMALPDRAPSGPSPRLTPEQRIGQMVERYPSTRDVLRRRFGDGCFTCPGFATETLAQGALMHGVDVEELIAELERTIGS